MKGGRGDEVHATYAEFDAMTYGTPARDLARRLRVHRDTVRLWRAGHRPVPWWVPKLLYYEDYYRRDLEYQMSAPLARRGLPYRPGSFVRDLVTRVINGAIDRGYAQLSERDVISRIEAERRKLERELSAPSSRLPDFSVRFLRVEIVPRPPSKRSGRRTRPTGGG